MEQPFEDDFQSEQQQTPTSFASVPEMPPPTKRIQSREQARLDPPRELPNRSYSLEPDMVNGWKPKNKSRINFNNVFSINYENQIVDEIVRQLYKNRGKCKDRLVYLGPRKSNSYILHENRSYQNPYPLDKKMDQFFSGRRGLPQQPIIQQCELKFDSDFESGNLDAAVQKGQAQFDLFMRVDSNTKGHTNWYYFSVQNKQFIGSVSFSLCNFRRQKSLYQRGLRPYVYSKLQDSEWQQGGKGVTYERKRPRYDFLYDDCDSDDEYMQTFLLTK